VRAACESAALGTYVITSLETSGGNGRGIILDGGKPLTRTRVGKREGEKGVAPP